MLVPRYWAKTGGSATGRDGKEYRFQIWGWSQQSPADALTAAGKRLSDLVSRVARGERVDDYSYGRQPLREEIVRSLGQPGNRTEAVVTRNRYGALVLCTASVPFVDIDAPPRGLIARAARLLKRKTVADPTLERIRQVCQRNSRHLFRIYRTRAGYRVLATNLFLDPRSQKAQDFLADFSADPYFIRLCRFQGSFRARLTPKPWRCACSLPPGQHPREEANLQREFATWRTRYESASSRFATCRFLESVGSGWASAETQAIVEEHDTSCRALSDLPLA